MRKYLSNPNRLFIIYAVRNKVNGKIYIGRTNRSLTVRWREHVTDARTKDKSYFHHAINKYGPESFKIKIIDHTAHEKEAYELEKKYVQMFKSDKCNHGYNSTPGGEGAGTVSDNTREGRSRRMSGSNHPLWGTHRPQEVKDRLREFHLANSPVYRDDVVIEEVVSFYAEGMSLRAIAKIYDVDSHTIADRLESAGVARRPRWNKSRLNMLVCQSKNWRNNKKLSKP